MLGLRIPRPGLVVAGGVRRSVPEREALGDGDASPLTPRCDGLEKSTFSRDAQSGAVSAEAGSLTPEALAVALLGLSPEDRARIAAMLLGNHEER
jgi:hypothetical protein